MTLQTRQHDDRTWWIEDVPPYRVNGETCTSCGPYDTRREADSDRVGLQRFFRQNPKYAKPANRPAGELVDVSPVAHEPGCLF